MAHGLTTAGGAVRRSVRFLSGRSVETSLEHADERDLIETFVERSRWHCRAARETFSTDEFQPVTTVNLSVTARMLLIVESRFGVSCDFKVLAVAEMSRLTTSARSKT